MGRIFSRLIRASLAAALVFGGVMTHAGSVVHAASSDFSVPHEPQGPADAKTADLAMQSDLSGSETDREDPSHTLGLCLDAHCCTPAVHMAAQEALRHSLESGKLGLAAASDYALSVTYSLLRPPRAIA